VACKCLIEKFKLLSTSQISYLPPLLSRRNGACPLTKVATLPIVIKIVVAHTRSSNPWFSGLKNAHCIFTHLPFFI